MACQKCNEILVLGHKKVTLHFLSEFDELIFKLNNFFEKSLLTVKSESGLSTIEVEDKKN